MNACASENYIKHCAPRISSKMATIDECIEVALNNIGLWWRYGISRHCDEWKYIIIRRIFESEIILISYGKVKGKGVIFFNWPYPITRRNFGWFLTFIKPRPYYDIWYASTRHISSPEDRITSIKHCAPRISSKMATIDECIEFALKNIGLWSRFESFWRYGFYSRVIVDLHSSQLRLIPYLHHTSSVLSEIFNEGGIKIISLSNIRPTTRPFQLEYRQENSQLYDFPIGVWNCGIFVGFFHIIMTIISLDGVIMEIF
jgi:hypothetical protein